MPLLHQMMFRNGVDTCHIPINFVPASTRSGSPSNGQGTHGGIRRQQVRGLRRSAAKSAVWMLAGKHGIDCPVVDI